MGGTDILCFRMPAIDTPPPPPITISLIALECHEKHSAGDSK